MAALLILALILIKVNISHSYVIQTNLNCECGVPNYDLDERIVGGNVVDAHRYPWVVAIVTELANDGHLCGGVLINDRYVLTAGHCVYGAIAIAVLLGKHDLSDVEEGMTVPALEYTLHPDYFYEDFRDINDIALIKLAEPVAYSRNIQAICLPKEDENYTSRSAQLAGWGLVLEKGNISQYLKETTVEVISLDACAKTKDGSYLNGNMLCTYTDGTDSCQGDSGGPLLLERERNKYETIGVISWGFGCAEKESPGVYTKVYNYLDWIYSETQDSIYCVN